MVKAGAALRRLIGSERLVTVFAMLSERDPVVLLNALRTVRPDAVVFTEPASAHGHAIPAAELAGIYGAGAHVERQASAALERARDLAGTAGNVLVCGSLYLVGESAKQRDDLGDQAFSRVGHSSRGAEGEDDERGTGDERDSAHFQCAVESRLLRSRRMPRSQRS